MNPWRQLVAQPEPPEEPSAVALRRLQALAAGEVAPAIVRWLQNAARAHLASPERRFDELLGVRPRCGEPSLARRYALAARAVALREAADLLVGERAHTMRHWMLLAAAVEEFESAFWPAWADSGPPAGASALRAALWRARKALDRPLPRDWRALRGAVQAGC